MITLRVALFATAATLPSLVRSPDADAGERPNIVWISCEDISPHLGCYGDPHATTPHLDRLAADGVRYTHAFAPAGVCAPCRSAIITGMYQTTLGTQHMRSLARLPESIQPFTVSLRAAGYYCTNNSKKDYQFREPGSTWDESSGKAHWRNRRSANQPFFSVFNFTECHESGIADDAKYRRVTEGIDKHDPAALTTLPPYYPGTPAVRDDWARYYDVITAMDRQVGRIVEQLKDDGLWDSTIVVFWSDHGAGLPRAKRWLYDSGIHVPLIVRVPAGFGELAPGAAGTTSQQLVSLVDLGPTMLNLAGVAVPPPMQGVPFAGPNCPPPREYVYACRDRMDERYDVIRAVRNHRFKYIRNYEPFKTYYQYMNTAERGRTMQEIRRVAAAGQLPAAAERFMAATKPVEELYDTASDPHEIHNLAGDPAHRRTLETLRAAHGRWTIETRDLGLMPEPEIAVREMQIGNRYDILRQPGADRLIERLGDAAAASLGGRDALPALRHAALDDDPAVRYWAAIGIGNVGDAASAGSIERLLKDPSAVVRIAAARALARAGRVDDALPVLLDTLETGRQWERLHAVIVLDELDEAARPAVESLRRARQLHPDLEQNGKYTVRVANRALNELEGTSAVVDE